MAHVRQDIGATAEESTPAIRVKELRREGVEACSTFPTGW
jgi:hypothetical protein